MTGTDPVETSGLPAVHPLRLYLPVTIPEHARACLDGAWWPYSDNLESQAVDLARVVGARWSGQVERITYDPSIWAATRRTIPRSGAALQMASSLSNEPHEVTLVMVDGRRVELLVVPAATPPHNADWMMRRAVERGSAAHGNDLIQLASGLAAPDRRPWDC